MTAHDPFHEFREDHRLLLGLLDNLERALAAQGEAAPASSALLAPLASPFATHMDSEERALYPAFATALPEANGSLGALTLEHHELRSMLERLIALLDHAPSAARDEQLHVQLRDFVDLFRIHIRKEEAAMFSVAARILTPGEARELASRIAAHHAKPMPPAGPAPERNCI